MTFLIHRLSDDMQMPAPPNAGQTIVRITGDESENGNLRYMATLITRTEEPNPVNPVKGISRAQMHTTWYASDDEQEAFGRLCNIIGMAVMESYRKTEDTNNTPIIHT